MVGDFSSRVAGVDLQRQYFLHFSLVFVACNKHHCRCEGVWLLGMRMWTACGHQRSSVLLLYKHTATSGLTMPSRSVHSDSSKCQKHLDTVIMV